MKKYLLNLKAVLMLALMLNISAIFAQNLLSNGDFETWQAGAPVGWTSESGTTITEESGIVHGGSKSMHVALTTITQANTDFQQSINITSGLTYNVSFWVYHLDTTSNVTIYSAGVWTNIYSVRQTINAWQQVTHSFTATTTGAVVFGLRFYDQAGWVNPSLMYIDDFSVTSVASTSPVITAISTNPSAPTSADPVNVSATITDDVSITSAYTLYSTDGVTYSDSILMSNVGSLYTTTTAIPAKPLGTVVYYKIKATDNASNTTTSTAYSYNLSLLAPGDAAIIQYRGDLEDGLSFVILKTINQQFTLKVTDMGWSGTAFASNEGRLFWESPVGGVTAGTVVTWQNNTGSDIGTVTKYGSFDLASTGDNIFLYTGDQSNPTFVYGLSNLPWITTGSVTTNNSFLPSTLTNVNTAVSFSVEKDNGYYNITPINGDPATIRASVGLESNWTFEDDGTILLLQPSSYWAFTVGINKIDNKKYDVYPNPANDIISLDYKSNVTKVVISNIIGQPVKNIYLNDSKSSINISDLQKGAYFVSFYNGEKLEFTKRIIKN